jgi:hypothetical protein
MLEVLLNWSQDSAHCLFMLNSITDKNSKYTLNLKDCHEWNYLVVAFICNYCYQQCLFSTEVEIWFSLLKCTQYIFMW